MVSASLAQAYPSYTVLIFSAPAQHQMPRRRFAGIHELRCHSIQDGVRARHQQAQYAILGRNLALWHIERVWLARGMVRAPALISSLPGFTSGAVWVVPLRLLHCNVASNATIFSTTHTVEVLSLPPHVCSSQTAHRA